MQGYYNYIQFYRGGGKTFYDLIAGIAKTAGRAKIQAHANLVSKKNPEFSKLLSKLAKNLNGGPKLTEDESKKLITLALDYRRSNIHYLNKRKKINELLAEKKKLQLIPVKQQAVKQQVASAPVLQQSVPAKTTLSSIWQRAKTWMNNHPKTTIGVPLIALGTGPGRYITGNAIKTTQSDPSTWFEELSLLTAGKLEFIMINGTKIPILRSLDGVFVPVLPNSQSNTNTDDLDAIIAEANNIPSTPTNSSNPIVPSLPGDPGYIDTSTVNDIFEEEQWL